MCVRERRGGKDHPQEIRKIRAEAEKQVKSGGGAVGQMSSRDDPDLTEVAFGDDDKDATINRCCSSRSSEKDF